MSTTTSIPSTMKAWTFSSTAGGMEKNMEIKKAAVLPLSKLNADQCLVQTLSMALNPVDYKIAELPLVGRMIGKPASPGLDFCGRIVSTGSRSVLKPGQVVFGRLEKPMQHGTLAEYVVTPQAGSAVLPEGVDPDHAASVGTAGLTAYQCIVPNVKKGDRVFINGGSGGTGIWGIQIAKTIGCHVTTSCSTPNVEFCKSLGADDVVDYKTQDVSKTLAANGQPFSLVIDNVGTPADLYSQCHKFLKQDGKFVQVGADSSVGAVFSLLSRMLLPGFLGGGKRGFQFIQVKNKVEDFEQMGQWMQEGKIKGVIEKTYTFDEAISAYQRIKTGRTRGKLVIKVAQP